MSRTMGWIAQWNEMLSESEQRISRPQQLYTGFQKRNFIKLNDR